MELALGRCHVLTKKRWVILVVCCLMNLCVGSLYAWSVFASPMAEHLSATTGTVITAAGLSIVFSLSNAVGPITFISGGVINDKFGPKWVVFAGGLIFGGGMILAGFANSMAMLIIGYSICCGLGAGTVYGCTISNCVKFFPDHRGLIGGIATASYGMSSVVIPPIARALTESYGVTSAFKFIGLAFIIIICIGAFFIEKCPEDFTPEGYVPAKPSSGSSKPQNDKNWKAMLRSPIFYVMILLLLCGANFGMMVISQASSIAQSVVGMTAAAATIVVSVLALFNAAGRVIAGYVSDKIGRINTLTCMLVLAIAALVLLYFCPAGSVALFYIAIALIGLCFGSFMGIYPGFTADRFGARYNSVNYGIMFIGFAAAGLIGPTIMTKVYSATGGYAVSFLIAIGLAIVGLCLSFIYRGMAKKQN